MLRNVPKATIVGLGSPKAEAPPPRFDFLSYRARQPGLQEWRFHAVHRGPGCLALLGCRAIGRGPVRRRRTVATVPAADHRRGPAARVAGGADRRAALATPAAAPHRIGLGREPAALLARVGG